MKLIYNENLYYFLRSCTRYGPKYSQPIRLQDFFNQTFPDVDTNSHKLKFDQKFLEWAWSEMGVASLGWAWSEMGVPSLATGL